MQFYKNHQKELKADLYKKTIEEQLKKQGVKLNEYTLLPASHTGSPRYQHANYVDAITILTQICNGRSDFFLTMTCNPYWKEITENLYDGQTASDRPDIVAQSISRKKRQH